MEKLKKIWNVTSTVLVGLVVACAIFLMGTRMMGYRVFCVLSGSMEPLYSVGDLIYVKPTPFSEIKVGDTVSFVLNEDLVVATHQVVSIDAKNMRLQTKGLTNDIPDDPIHYNNVIGVAKFALPKMGYVANFVQNPPGMYIAIAVGVVLLVTLFLPDLKKKKEDPSAEEGAEAPAEPTEEPAEPTEEAVEPTEEAAASQDEGAST
jgi:signal peptidase